VCVCVCVCVCAVLVLELSCILVLFVQQSAICFSCVIVNHTIEPRPPFDTQRQRQQLLQDWESMELSNLQKTCLERGLDFNKAVEARDKQNAIVLQNMEKGKKLLGPTKMPNYFNTGDLVVNQTDKKLGHSASAPALNAGRELEARANTAQRLRHKLMESSVLTVATDLLNPRPATFRTIVAEPAFPARRQRRGHQLSRSTTSFHDYIQHKRAESKMSEHTNNSGPAGRPSVEQFDGYGMNRKFAKFYQKETSKPAPLHLLRQDIPIPDVSEIRYFSNGYFPRTGPAKKKALEKTWVWDFPHSNVVDT